MVDMYYIAMEGIGSKGEVLLASDRYHLQEGVYG